MVLTTPTLEAARDSVKDGIESTFLYVAVGDGDTVPSEGDTQLEGETFRSARIEVDKTTFASEVTVTGEVGFGDANGAVIREVGWFTASSGGTLQARDVLLNSITKTSDISVVLPKTVSVEVTEV